MLQSHNLDLARRDGQLTVTSSYMGVAFATLWTAAVIAMLVKEAGSDISLFLKSSFELGVSGLLLGTGVFAMFPRKIITSFDARGFGITQSRIVCGVWTWRNRHYAFRDIAGVGVQERSDDGRDVYFPVIMLKGGKTVRLIYDDESRAASAEVAAQICAETGLPRLDVSWRDERNDDRAEAASTTQTISTAE